MGYWQRENIREDTAMTVGATYKLELPKHGFLGSLLLEIHGDEISGYGQDGTAWTLVDKISKIEVMGNGSTVIKSLTGKQLQALAMFDQGVMPPSVLRNYASNTQFDYFLINFGRFMYDPEMYLDLEQFDNVELWITNTAAATTFSNMHAKVTAFWAREATKAGYLGYLRTETWKEWTTVSDEWVYNDLPTQHLIRRILLQAIPHQADTTYLNNCNIEDLMYDIKLQLDTGKLIAYDGSLRDLYFENYLDFGKVMLRSGWNYNMASRAFDVGLGNVLGGAAAAAGATASAHKTLGLNYNRPTQYWLEYAGDVAGEFIFSGLAPFDCGVFRFDQSLDPAHWLNPDLRKTVKLDIHTRSGASYAEGTNAIVLDRLVK